jgi:cytochrome P450
MTVDTDHRGELDLAAASGKYLLDVTAKRNPYRLLDQLRRDDPVHESDAGTWIVSGYELGLAVLRDSRFSRAAATERDVTTMFDPSEATDVYWHKTVNREGVDHTRLRRLLTPAFSPRAVRGWRPFIERAVDEIFDGFAPREEGDLVADLAYPIPEHIICTMLGVPASDHKLFEEWTRVLNARPQAGVSDDERRRVATAALTEFVEYLRALIARRRTDPRDDLVTQLISLEEEGDRLNERELVAVMMEIINGGHDTTANTIVNGVFMLLQHPDQLDRIKADPELVDTAVEEILRYRSSVQLSLTRVTTADVELAGVTVPQGATVVVSLAGANRDPNAFDDPERMNVGRDENRHLSFGNGAHFCLGAHLARSELQVTFDRLLRRLQDLRLTVPVDEVPWRTTTLVMAPAQLPCAWRAA